MGSSLSKPESGFRKSVSKRLDKVFKPKSSGQATPIQAPSVHSPSPNPVPSPNPNAGSTAGLAPIPVPATPQLQTPAPTTPARAPSPVPSISPPAEPATASPALIPTQTQTTCPTGAWAVLESSLRALHKGVEVFPPVQSAVGSIIACLDVMQKLAENHDEREELASELATLSSLMVQHIQQSNSPRMSDAVINVARGIEEQVKTIEERRNRGAGRRLMEARDEEELLNKCYRRMGSLFRQLQADASMSMWKIVNDQASNALLDRLGPVHLATYDSTLSTSISRRTCTANTRTAILSGLNDWSHDPNLADIYWMNGMAGTGKTTIACTFAESLEQTKRLAASFFCTRTRPECRSANRILPTIAYQLGRYSVPFQSALCQSLQANPDVGNKNLTKQFDRLLKEPLLKVKEAMPGHLVVVIDALDECDDMRQVELLLSILLRGAEGLPIRFFVTSRPEPEIYHRMLLGGQEYRKVLHLHAVETSLVQADIELYLRTELAPIFPELTDIQELVQRSGTLFIYAATLVRYIQPNKPHTHPKGRLRSVLSMNRVSTAQYAAVDTLYRSVLEAALNEQESGAVEVEDVRRVLHTVVCAQEPMSIGTLTVMSKLDDEAQTLAALEPLRAVLHIPESDGPVTTLHASFPDFMFDQTRSQMYHCDISTFSIGLAQCCFEVMESQLRFNICDLESSFVRDDQVEDLNGKIARAISPVLWYACQYWSDHLGSSNHSDPLCSDLEGFLSDRLLFWMEVMNLRRKIGTGLQILAKAGSWISSSNLPNDVSRYVEDARKFVSTFAANPVSQSTPHIYLSSLPFCPKSNSVFCRYYPKMNGLISVTGTIFEGVEEATVTSWTVESEVYSVVPSPDGSRVAYGCKNGVVAIRSLADGVLVIGPLEGHTSAVNSVAYSPDGTQIASGSDDGTVRVWDAWHESPVAGQRLGGHESAVRSVAYSPNGTHIISGSDDRTIRLWDAEKCTLVAGPFQGHTDSVRSVAYSPDGTRIASGSSDGTVRIWNAQDGTSVTAPFEGRAGAIACVAYSQCGTRIASGSDVGTIRVINAQDGAPVLHHSGYLSFAVRSIVFSSDGTRIVSSAGGGIIRVWNIQGGMRDAGSFRGHTSGVASVVYSPNGTHIISGSFDSTIRVWNAEGDTSVAKKPDNHSDIINSVAYSPDGTRIVSGSRDRTLRIWHAQNGSLVVGPLQGHAKAVMSVAYSPKGIHIVSGSGDCTIRVWNAHDGALVLGPLEGHTNLIRSVTYSPDGTRIVSGSDDCTIRVWDAEDGTLVAGPLEGHTGWVRSVVYSPDGTRIASGSNDGTIRVWNAHDGTLDVGPLEGHSSQVTSVAYSPDGTRIASGYYRTIRVWSVEDGALVAGPFEGHTEWIWSVAYSPDGTRIVSGSWDRTIRVWNAEDGTLVAGPFKGHTNEVNSVAYSPDGTCIVSGSTDEKIRVWSARNGPSISGFQVEGHTNPEIINCIADGASTDRSGWVTASDSRLLLWVPPEVQLRDMLSQPRCRMVVGPAGSLGVEYGGLVLGRRWAECYQP